MTICLQIPPAPEPMAVPFPGGLSIEGVSLEHILQPALAPLAPFFTTIDVIAALVEVVKAVPDAISVPPQPQKLGDALVALGPKVAKLLELLPPLSLPLLALRLTDVLIAALSDLRGKLARLVAELDGVAKVTARGRALQDANLLSIAVCLETNIGIEAANVGKSFASLGRLLGMLDLFLGMIGGPDMPDLSRLSGKPLRDVLAPLSLFIDTLVTVRKAIPV
jgi:hypothetical protein